MSILLRHLSKLNLKKPKDALKNQSVRLSQTPPYLTIGFWLKEDSLHLYDPVKEETIKISDKTLPEELNTLELQGISHGWGLFMDQNDSSVVRISDFFLPSASKSSPKITLLPPMCPLPDYKLESVKKVSMSTYPDQEDEECVIAVKFMGFQLSLCVPGRDSEWTNIVTPFEYFHNNSSLTYSKRDKSFYMLAPGSRFLASWHIHSKNWDYPKFHELQFHNIPRFWRSEWQLLDSCAKTEHLLEAPSGECFLVKWYGESLPCVFNEKETIYYKTNRFMVFRQEEASKDGVRSMCYTEDIGDICIFLGDNEPFCVQASSCPGLKPNSIYFMGYGFGVYDLATKTTQELGDKGLPGSVFACPYWIPPVFL
ncbi:PREDICTED: uncharacterized protein LOC104711048 [Camelina sativa]|uniref:Uncharacterized protein LOC104711048 n=1 Tax=Camelina sativa TaxID=90675 RepID=A0ABM0TGD7_CAMSA|nr:PREDICTED: uncharacterized protein LOC104711048 [Camelina sativa]